MVTSPKSIAVSAQRWYDYGASPVLSSLECQRSLAAGISAWDAGQVAVRSFRRRRLLIAWPIAFVMGALIVWAMRYRDIEYASWMVGAIVGTAVPAVALVAWAMAARPGASSGEQIALAQENLVRLSYRRWRDEVTLRQLRSPEPIAVRWRSTSLDQAYDITRLSTTAVSGSADQIAQLSAAIDALPGKRVAIIGSRGSGKSTLALLLVVARLSSWAAGQAIPVLLSASAWDPQRENLRSWLQRRIGEEFPALKDSETYGTSVVGDLVADRMIVPVLDGLDELPAERLGLAMRAVNREFDSSDPIILTCRTQEYLLTVERFGVLSSAHVIEPQPISAADAAAYLRGIPARQVQRQAWQQVFTELGAHPNGALSHAFSTPLMVTLARIAYGEPDADPARLLAFLHRQQIEDHLLDALVPSALRTEARRDAAARVASRNWNITSTDRWMVFLARHLERSGARDLEWWRLGQASRLPSFVTGMLIAAAVSVNVVWPIGVLAGAAYLAFDLLFRRGERRPVRPTHISLKIRGRVRQLVRRILFRAIACVQGAVISILFVWATLDARRMAGPMLDAGYQASDVTLGLIFGGTFLAIGGIFLAVGVVSAVLAWIGMPISSEEADDPWRSQRADGVMTAISIFAFGASVGWTVFGAVSLVPWLFASIPGTLSSSPTVAGLSAGLMAALVGTAFHAWPAYKVVHLYLVLRRKLPMRLSRFLKDAHKLGLLRQVGGAFQFRHLRLQQRLADRSQ